MRAKTFAKGVHPWDFKELSKQRPTEVVKPGKRVVIPLHQHTGAPAEPLVKKGDRLLVGQKIGEAKGFISAPVHSSVSGTVLSVAPFLSPVGRKVLCVEIENDDGYEVNPSIRPCHEGIEEYTPQEVRESVREAGIVGLGGAAFPTAVKLSPPKDQTIDAVVLNGAECEPYLTTDHRLMLERADEILKAAEAVRMTVGAKGIHVGIEENKGDVIDLWSRKVKGFPHVHVEAVKTKYPQGGEKMLIKALLNREVPCGGLPFNVGVIVQNVGTLNAVYDSLTTGMPLIKRGLTISGDGVAKPSNLEVSIGTLFSDLIEGCGGYKGDVNRVLMGGPMMGISQSTDQVPVIKATSGILVMSGAAPGGKEYPCIGCNSCTNHCPMGLVPTTIVSLVRAGKAMESKDWGLTDCMECGTCAFVCPAHIPLVQWVRYGKAEYLKEKKRLESQG